MILSKAIHINLLALLCLFCASATHAHSLPGSVVTLSEQTDQALSVSISFPLEDLLIAAPELKALSQVDVDQKLSDKLLEELAAYLQQHLSLQRAGEKLPIKAQQAEVDVVYNEHLGYFKSVFVTLLVTHKAPEKWFPLQLSYDVIMHEIRNHRATVYWQEADKSLTKLTNFGFKKSQGKPVVHRLNH
ncbi:hypothetical protein [Psychromonas sp. GE-S-Ul-11]|uniref:hypothetical protein n=1 Tax=Psychromonas sp. GE-S-Ul-11 TaxID=3241170 RepID=UPI00390C4C5C